MNAITPPASLDPSAEQLDSVLQAQKKAVLEEGAVSAETRIDRIDLAIAEREIAVWEWLAGQYEKRTTGIDREEEKNRIFKELLTETVNYEPLGVRKLPAE